MTQDQKLDEILRLSRATNSATNDIGAGLPEMLTLLGEMNENIKLIVELCQTGGGDFGELIAKIQQAIIKMDTVSTDIKQMTRAFNGRTI